MEVHGIVGVEDGVGTLGQCWVWEVEEDDSGPIGVYCVGVDGGEVGLCQGSLDELFDLVGVVGAEACGFQGDAGGLSLEVLEVDVDHCSRGSGSMKDLVNIIKNKKNKQVCQ